MLYRELTLENPDRLNAALYDRFMAVSGTQRVRQTHHISGRFENTYIDRSDIPEVGTVLNTLRQQAAQLLDVPVESLKAGFWFNAMEAGHTTSLHHHDENDELLSAVYYVRVPERSGDLVLHDGDERVTVHPAAGKLVMFAPGLLHEVTTHRGSGLRLSIGMNVGPVEEQAS